MVSLFRFFFLVALVGARVGYSQSVASPPVGTDVKPASVAPADLYRQIARVDSLVFQAFNNCDSMTYRNYFTDDLEFYHDLGGLTKSLASELASLKEMCARGTHIRRELIKSSLEVYPLKGYGAVEMGTHRFYHTNSGQSEKLSGTYKFVQVWQNKNGQWKIARVISYGHTDMKNN